MLRRDKNEQEYIIGEKWILSCIHLREYKNETGEITFREKELADIVQKRLDPADTDS